MIGTTNQQNQKVADMSDYTNAELAQKLNSHATRWAFWGIFSIVSITYSLFEMGIGDLLNSFSFLHAVFVLGMLNLLWITLRIRYLSQLINKLESYDG